jgi:hypothetical protein
MNGMKRQVGVRIVIAIVTVLALLVLWPNLVHEQAHVVALKLQGSEGVITYDFALPAHPFTTRMLPVRGIAGGLAWLLAPSVLSVVLLGWLWATRKQPHYLLHGVLGPYLLFDLEVNLLRFARPGSDFYFLTVVSWTPVLLIGTTITSCIVAYLLIKGLLEHLVLEVQQCE